MVSRGDLIVVRVDEIVAGWGIVEHIEVTLDSRKEIIRCPSCRKTNHYRRKLALPNNKCNSCKYMFHDDEAIKTEEKVTAYRAYYANTWTEAARPVHRKELDAIIEKSDSFYETYGNFHRSQLILEPDRRPDRDLIGAHYEQSIRVFAHN